MPKEPPPRPPPLDFPRMFMEAEKKPTPGPRQHAYEKRLYGLVDNVLKSLGNLWRFGGAAGAAALLTEILIDTFVTAWSDQHSKTLNASWWGMAGGLIAFSLTMAFYVIGNILAAKDRAVARVNPSPEE